VLVATPKRRRQHNLGSNLNNMDTINNNKTIKRKIGIDPNPIKTREMLDRDGNVIDPQTKQIIKRNIPDKNE
jgi:hypothetical protein